MTNDKTSNSILVQLYDNRPLCTKVDTLLDEGKAIKYVQTFCQAQGFEISVGSLNNYKKKREEAIRKGVSVSSLLDRRVTKGEVIELNKHKEDGEDNGFNNKEVMGFSHTEKRAVTILSFLEDIIDKGMAAIAQTPVVDPALALKAVDMHNKISGGNAGGLTVFGMQEMRLKLKAIETAYMTVIMEFVPEEQHDEIFKRFEQAEQEFYDNLDLSEEGRKMKEALKDIGL